MTRALMLFLAACTARVTVEPECSSEHDDCADEYGEGWVCCLSEGVCVADEPRACGVGGVE